MKDPTNCDRCGLDLDGWRSERWRGEKRIEVVCNGCDRKERVAEYLKTRVLSTSLVTVVAIDAVRREFGNPPLLTDNAFAQLDADVKRVNEAVARFEENVWFARLVTQVRASTSSHMRGRGQGFEILTMASAARWMATIEGMDGASITVITEEGSNTRGRMGLQGIDCTAARAMELLALVESSGLTLRDARGKGFVLDASEGK